MRRRGVFTWLVLACAVACAQVPDARLTAPEPRAAQDQDLAAALRSLSREVAGLRGRFPVSAVPGGLPRASSSLEETYVALAAVQLEKARDYSVGLFSGPDRAAASIRDARKVLQAKETASPPRLVRSGRMFEHAYFARNDGSPQPYYVFVPPQYKPGRACPLMVFLHGWVPDTSRTNPWTAPEYMVELAERRGVLLAVPHGRTNTDFQFVGEVDVLRVIAEMKAFYTVDPDRVYLTGVSMGGAGAWQIALHYPHVFAGVAPVSPQGDWFKFWHEQFNYPVREQLPRHVAWILAMHNPADLARNLSSLYSFSQQSLNGFLGIEHTRIMTRQLKAFDAPHDAYEDNGMYGHYIYFQPECWERVFDRLLPRRREPAPKTVRYVTYSPRFDRAYWVRIADIETWGQPATIEARLMAEGRVNIQSANVGGVCISPPAAWASGKGTFDVQWNGREHVGLKGDAAGRIALGRLPSTAATNMPPRKTRAVCGPMSDVLNFPFVLVYGTVGTEQETALSLAAAKHFAADWYGYAEGRAHLLRDVDVTDRMIHERGLVLFGLPESNKLIARIAPRLPFRLSREAVTLPDGKSFQTEGTGLVLTYPNPLAPQRYVVIRNGVPWGGGRSNNHRFDLLPDFAIYTADTIPGLGINRYLAAGLFDENWHYDPKLVDFAPPRPASTGGNGETQDP